MKNDHYHNPDEEPQGLEIKDPELLWCSGYYDGAISGMIKANGEMLWAKMITECSDTACGFYRRYEVMRLDAETLAAEIKRHQLFLQHVAGVESGWSLSSNYRPQSEWHLFYDAYPPTKDHEPTGEVIGWFQR